MNKFKGRLMYMGWFNRPWNLMTEDDKVDLWPVVDKFFVSLDGKRASHEQTRDSYILSVNKKDSEYRFKYVPDECVLLEKPKDFGFSNIHAYLDSSLVWLSGRMVEIEVEDGQRIKIMADKDYDGVNGVYFVGEGNSCEVQDGDEKDVCRIGQHDCCIFLSAGSDGFRCEKFSGSTALLLLDRLAKGDIRASRIGSCTVLGRKE